MTEEKKEQMFEISKIYIKDMSTEAPNTPEIFKSPWEPEINLQLDNSLKNLEEDGLYEISLKLTVTANTEEKVAYIAEVEQAGIFTIDGFPKEQTEYIIGSVIPNILFPYARETISSLTQKAGFPPMLLNPIDFNALYEQSQQEQSEDANQIH